MRPSAKCGVGLSININVGWCKYERRVAVNVVYLPHEVVVLVQVDVFGWDEASGERTHLCSCFNPRFRENTQTFSCKKDRDNVKLLSDSSAATFTQKTPLTLQREEEHSDRLTEGVTWFVSFSSFSSLILKRKVLCNVGWIQSSVQY